MSFRINRYLPHKEASLMKYKAELIYEKRNKNIEGGLIPCLFGGINAVGSFLGPMSSQAWVPG